MSIEVEQKYRVADRAALERQLAGLRAVAGETVEQVDCYFAHPVRDFAATDEALRVRQQGQRNYITYKGPKLDRTTKTRREIEFPLADGQSTAADASELLEALGFSQVADVHKCRAHYTAAWQDREITIVLDHIAKLGDFVELEVVTSQQDMEAARDCLAELSDELGLADPERRSYLELLLEQSK